MLFFLVLPTESYHPDNFGSPDEKDDTLKNMMEILNILSEQQDVREFLIGKYNLRQMAINSKLL